MLAGTVPAAPAWPQAVPDPVEAAAPETVPAPAPEPPPAPAPPPRVEVAKMPEQEPVTTSPTDIPAGPEPTFGQYLARAREKRGLSLDDLAHLTKIRRAIVESLERDARRELPEKVFVIGYVRSYAAAVGLDVEDTVRRFSASWTDFEPTSQATSESTQSRSWGWIPPLLAAIVAAIVIWYIVTSG